MHDVYVYTHGDIFLGTVYSCMHALAFEACVHLIYRMQYMRMHMFTKRRVRFYKRIPNEHGIPNSRANRPVLPEYKRGVATAPKS